MNKTVTINISGIIFHIEEDAYQALSNYLSTIKGYFSKTDGGNEIMADIEARIAELLQQKINVNKQVVLMADVENVMEIMGKPEEFAGDESNQQNTDSNQQHTQFNDEKIKRRLFRNPDEKAIGGVCSGLAAYFDVDIVWVRLAMFLLIFFGGLSLWVYLVMWIIIPEAKTTADRLAMRGEPINIDNISKTVKEEAEELKNKYGKNFDSKKFAANVKNGVSSTTNTIANIIGRLVGLFIVFLGGALLIAYISSIFGISVAHSNSDVSNWKSVIFSSTTDYALGVFAFIIALGIPIFMLLYAGIKLLFKIRYSNRWLNLSLGVVWLIGLIIGFYVTVSTVKGFNETSKVKETIMLHGIGDTLIIKLNPAMATIKPLDFENADDLDTYFGKNHSGYQFGELNKKLSIIGYANLDIIENNSDSVELIINYSSRGPSKKEANENAKFIKYAYTQNSNELIFDEVFSVLAGTKFRAQEVNIKLKLPKGKVIYFDNSVKFLLEGVDNTTNTWDGDMTGRRWQMTDKGLACIDCNGLDSNSDDDEDDNNRKEQHIIINGTEIKVDEKGTNIKIDENGIKVNDKDAKVKIDENGNIKIKTTKKEKVTEDK